MLSNHEILILTEFVTLLQPIEWVTNAISGDTYPTCSVIIPLVYCMRSSLLKQSPSTETCKIFQTKLLTQAEVKKVNPTKNNSEDFDFWDAHDALARASANRVEVVTEGLCLELRQYLAEPVIGREKDPFKYWQSMRATRPNLFKVPIKYLSVIGTSVPSERLFSIAGLIKSDKRNRLGADNLNQVQFLSCFSREEWD